MGSVLLLVALVSCTLRSAVAEDSHLLVYKGRGEISSECRQYLGYPKIRSTQRPPDHCELYCGALVARVWNLTEGTIDLVRVPWFYPVDGRPKEFFTTVDQCFDRVKSIVPMSDQCRRIDEHLRCLNMSISRVDQSFYISRSSLQHRRTVDDCAGMLQIPAGELGEIYRQGLVNHPRGRCLVRCFLIREQLYSEQIGVDPFRVLMKCGQISDIANHEKWRDQVRVCVGRLQRQVLDRCTLAARIASECFGKQLMDLLEESVRPLVGSS